MSKGRLVHTPGTAFLFKMNGHQRVNRPYRKAVDPSTPPPVIDLLPAPRRAVVEHLKHHGPSRAEDISHSLGVTISGIRQHLAALGAEGFVTFAVHRGLPGRPKHYFHLTRHGEELFRKDYGAFLTQTVTFLQRRDPALLRELFQLHLDTRFRRARARAASLGYADRVGALAEELDTAGFMPSTIAGADGGYELTLRNCPLLEVARCAPEFCDAEAEEIARVLRGTPPARTTHQLAGDAHCTYYLPAAAAED